MKKFGFRLQSLLDLARRRLEMAQRALGAALAELRQAEEAERAAAARERDAADEFLATASGGRMVASDLRLLQGRLDALERATVATRAVRLEREARWRLRHDDMVEARKELLALERAREKAWDEWREEAERDEMAQLDEIASTRHAAAETRRERVTRARPEPSPTPERTS